jgi:RsiW-degrading membrane proteinase PrsW (M82 family)
MNTSLLFSLLALALAPGLYLGIRMYLKDKYEPEPKGRLLVAFIAGCAMCVPSATVEHIVLKILGIAGLGNLGTADALIAAFLVIAVAEEGAKFLLLRFCMYPDKEFNEPLDGIVYGAFVALGFATFENLFYVVHHGYVTGIGRMFLSVPSHYSWGVIMGYYLGKAKFETQHQTAHMLRGLFYAIVLHGAFDFFIMQKAYPLLVVFTLVVWLVALIISHREIKELQADSMRRCNEKPPVILPAPLK